MSCVMCEKNQSLGRLFFILHKKVARKLWKMFAGLPPSQDKHDIVRILKNGYDF